ncbi:MAG: AmmeMemoRadiSam system protein B [Phycisphaerae bacterium]|nr:AmmeMemoRadiSam system protein B [Phycisphaerae bacterium]
MQIRHPVAAGSFYEADEKACRASLAKCIEEKIDSVELPQRIVAGIVPHAGWIFSGQVAGEVFRSIAQQGEPEVFVLFGAMHRSMTQLGGMFADGAWRTPLGDALVDERLAERILGGTNLIERNARVHADEHSLEVIVPFIQYLFGRVKILPIAVPPVGEAHEIGQAVGRILAAEQTPAVCIGSTDLTHYGPGYGFAPQGAGQEGIIWAKDVNDRSIIDLICGLESQKIVAEAELHRNACGAGAVAATIGAAVQMGAERAKLLSHISSAEASERLWGQKSSESVGYAGIVFG